MFRVDLLQRNGTWEAVGEAVGDSEFETEQEAATWIAENILYRVDENATRGEYRIERIDI